jgi:hypothetical protein
MAGVRAVSIPESFLADATIVRSTIATTAIVVKRGAVFAPRYIPDTSRSVLSDSR